MIQNNQEILIPPSMTDEIRDCWLKDKPFVVDAVEFWVCTIRTESPTSDRILTYASFTLQHGEL